MEPAGPSTTVPLPTTAAHPAPTANVTKFVHAQEPITPIRTPLGFLTSPDGREAALRIAQYTLRLTLYLRNRYLSTPTLSRLLAVVSTLSALRRLVALYDLTIFLYQSYHPSRLLGPLGLKKDVKGKGRADGGRKPTRPWRLDDLLRLSRAVLDSVSIMSDNAFLLARMSLVPLSKRNTRKADRIADISTLLAALLGLYQVAHSRAQVWEEGRAVRKTAQGYEQQLEEHAFWTKGEGDEVIQAAEQLEKEREERRLKHKVKSERAKLKRLRDELNELWWERLRLTAEGLFATYDVLELHVGSEGVKALSGFASAAIMASQAWHEYAPPLQR